MAKKICIDLTELLNKFKGDEASRVFIDPERVEYSNQSKVFSADIEITQKCAGSCAYCYTASTPYTETHIPTKKVLELIDEAAELGIKVIDWCGGDPILHPEWYEIVSYGSDKGFRQWLLTSTLISKKVAKEICQLRPSLMAVSVDISTINPEAYRLLHTDPSTLEKKIQGYHNLLEAGFPPEEILPIIACTRPAINTIEETIDWLVDEMGAKVICLVQFKPDEFGKNYTFLEPTPLEIKKALEYRAKKLGSHWLKVATMDTSKFYCRTTMGIKFDGRVTPCVNVPIAVGNIYEESLKDIIEKHRDTILINHDIEGYCGSGECLNADLCFGCRGTAYFCNEGDMFGSDLKCFLHPEAKDYYFQKSSEERT